jgi:hypothetical protein
MSRENVAVCKLRDEAAQLSKVPLHEPPDYWKTRSGVQCDAPDCTPEPLARLSNERPSRFGLVSSRRFADEDDLGVGAALADDGLAGAALCLHLRQVSICPVILRKAALLSATPLPRARGRSLKCTA